jgi:glycopeptide antibiotics resistance protein
VLHRSGLPDWIGYGAVESGANVLLFVPFGLLATLGLQPKHRWAPIALGLASSAAIELGQLLFLPARTASWADVLANTSGAALGVLAALALRKRAPNTAEDAASRPG